MANRIATVSGTALVPGVSKNGRLYTPELIAKAVARAQERIAEGTSPLTMLTHHAAGDDSTRIVGSLTSLTVAEDGSAKFTADLAKNEHARNIASLIDPAGGAPHLRGVSIRGAWVGNVRRERGPNGQTAETADDLELFGLDFTATPGVPGAGIDDVRADGMPRESAGGRQLIYESAEALVSITEEVTEADAQPAADEGPYADPGYLRDRSKRWPLGTKANAWAAWRHVTQESHAGAYTAPQRKRIKGRVVKALKGHGVNVTAERWLVDSIAEAAPAGLAEDYAGMYGDGPGTFCLNATNGPLSVTVSSYCIDPADLELILHAVVDGAMSALKAIDPDLDADIDVPGADTEDTDDDTESAPAGDTLAEAEPAPEPPKTPEEPAPAGDTEIPAPVPAADQTKKEEPAMADTTPAVEPTPAAPVTTTAAPGVTLSMEQFEKLLAAARGPQVPALVGAESVPAPVAPAQESAPVAPAPVAPVVPAPVAETEEARITRLVAEGIAAQRTSLIQEMVESGGAPARKGLVAPVNEHTAAAQGGDGVNAHGHPVGWPDKPMHEFTADERMEFMGPALRQHVLQDRFRG